MSQYPAYPLSNMGDNKADEHSSLQQDSFPPMSYPGYPINPESAQQGVGFNNPNMAPSGYPAQPSYPNQTGYTSPPEYPNQPGYPNPPMYSEATGYPNQPDSNPPIYPDQTGYPNQPGYQNPPVYPNQPIFPGQSDYQAQPGYPAQPAYPAQPGFSNQPTGYPTQPGFPGSVQIGYPGQPGQPSFPPMDPRGFMPMKPIDVKEGDGDAGNPMLGMGDGGEGGAVDVGSSFSDKKIRHAFIKKVYLILTAQLMCTAGFVAFFLLNPPVRYWVLRNLWFYWMSYAIFIITYFMLACPCCMGLRRKWPWNFIFLILFTLAMSYMVGTICCFYKTDSVLIALVVTTVVCLAVSIFAVQTKIDFTLCRGVLFVFSIVFLLFGIACIVVYSVWGPNYILEVVYGSIGALFFSLFLLCDTQMIVGGTHRKHQISPEEYIFGALQLYLDIVNLFLMLLRIVGAVKKN